MCRFLDEYSTWSKHLLLCWQLGTDWAKQARRDMLIPNSMGSSLSLCKCREDNGTCCPVSFGHPLHLATFGGSSCLSREIWDHLHALHFKWDPPSKRMAFSHLWKKREKKKKSFALLSWIPAGPLCFEDERMFLVPPKAMECFSFESSFFSHLRRCQGLLGDVVEFYLNHPFRYQPTCHARDSPRAHVRNAFLETSQQKANNGQCFPYTNYTSIDPSLQECVVSQRTKYAHSNT